MPISLVVIRAAYTRPDNDRFVVARVLSPARRRIARIIGDNHTLSSRANRTLALDIAPINPRRRKRRRRLINYASRLLEREDGHDDGRLSVCSLPERALVIAPRKRTRTARPFRTQREYCSKKIAIQFYKGTSRIRKFRF